MRPAANGNCGVYYLAQFNVGEKELRACTDIAFLGTENPAEAFEIWSGKKANIENNTIVSDISPHGVNLYKIKTL